MWMWRARIKAHARLGRDVGIWFHPDYSADDLAAGRHIPNIELDRSEQVLARLTERGLVRVNDVRVPRLASIEELGWVHGRDYLEASAEPATLAHVFGVDPNEIDVDVLARAQRRATGATMEAALAVSRGELATAVNLGGGFHHAEPDRGSGFCVYNDVAVAIARLRHDGYAAPIAIVDLDFHQGNGNLVAFAADATVLTYSLHGAEWTNVAAVANRDVQLPPRSGDEAYLAALRETLPQALQTHAPRLVFYIAGTDVLASDALGDFVLTPRGVLDRDIAVTTLVRSLGAGLVVTMGGGYNPRAAQATASYVRWLLTDDRRAPRDPEAPLRRRFRQISRAMGPSELQRVSEDELVLGEEDLQGSLIPGRPPHLVLGYYTKQGIEIALERFGFLGALRSRGFSDLRLDVGGVDDAAPILRIHGRATGHAAELLLMELIVRKKVIAAPPAARPPDVIEALMIEWLLLQNPTRSFAPGRPRLPGQSHPGLGLAGLMQEILLRVVARLRLEGLLSRPSHYHNAALAGPQYQFLDPRVEGRFRAMRRALASVTVPEGTALVDAGALRDARETVIPWEPGDQMLPTSPRLTAYFASDAFQNAAALAMQELVDSGLHVVSPSQDLPGREHVQ